MGMRTRSKSSISGRPARLIEWISVWPCGGSTPNCARRDKTPQFPLVSEYCAVRKCRGHEPPPHVLEQLLRRAHKGALRREPALAVPVGPSVVTLDDPFHLRSSGLSSGPDDTRVGERFGCFKSSKAYLSTGRDRLFPSTRPVQDRCARRLKARTRGRPWNFRARRRSM